MAVSTSRIVNGFFPSATALRARQSATARMPPRLSEGWPHSAASQVSLKSSQRIIVPMIECGLYRVELKPGARHPCTIRHGRTLSDRSKQPAAGRVSKRFHRTPQRIHQAITRRFVRQIALNLAIGDIVGNIGEHLIRLGTGVRDKG